MILFAVNIDTAELLKVIAASLIATSALTIVFSIAVSPRSRLPRHAVRDEPALLTAR